MRDSRIASKLYQGSLPPYVEELHRARIHTIVLCARELQPDDWRLPGIEVLRCPFVDVAEPVGLSTLRMIDQTSTAVAARVRAKQRTLVTCAAGLNRSGLVTALALTKLYGISGHDAVKWVQRERPGALFNPVFAAILEQIPATVHAAAASGTLGSNPPG